MGNFVLGLLELFLMTQAIGLLLILSLKRQERPDFCKPFFEMVKWNFFGWPAVLTMLLDTSKPIFAGGIICWAILGLMALSSWGLPFGWSVVTLVFGSFVWLMVFILYAFIWMDRLSSNNRHAY